MWASTASCTFSSRRPTACSSSSRPAAWPPPTKSSIASEATWRAEDGRCSLATVDHLYEAALYLGRLSQEVAAEHRDGLTEVGADGTATFILGGHVGPEPPDIILVYPEGNYIRASDERPFLQIGETKYGKFMLELAVEARVDLETATKIALGSMMSTARANLSVGPPYDVAICLNDSRRVNQYRIQSDSALLEQLRQVWERLLLHAVAELPAVSGGDLEEFLEQSFGSHGHSPG